VKPEELRSLVGYTVKLRFAHVRGRLVTIQGQLGLVDGPEFDAMAWPPGDRHQIAITGVNTYWIPSDTDIECDVL
jgi:hypothetical protein